MQQHLWNRTQLAFPLVLLVFGCVFGFSISGDARLVAQTTDPPAARILFEAYADANWDLWSMLADGSDLQNVTTTPNKHELYPQASPDGKHICFLVDETTDRSTLRSLWLMQADGTKRQKIADNARHACWSPDGKRIAFAQQEFPKFNIKDFVTKSLYFYEIDKGTIAKHPNSTIEHIYVPTWSANGKWLVTTVHGGMGFGHAIIAIEVDGDRVVDLKIGGCRPCLSNNGSQITWSRDDHTICVADISYPDEGPIVSHIRTIYQHPTLHLYHPDFSPDGQSVTFSMGPGGRVAADGPGTHTEVAEMVGVKGLWDIYLQSINATTTTSPRQLTHRPHTSNKESEWILTP
ncbi:MAG: hypothetical protein CMJ80_05720 [Planctomycetaceae bacterium]|nr:hypothetical protein [Planctomycetaceae bacterium]